jgi:hypothetical protein
MAIERRGSNKQICFDCQRLKAENDLLRLEIERLKRKVSGNNEQSKQEDYGTTYCSDFVPVEMIVGDHSSSDVVVTKVSTIVLPLSRTRNQILLHLSLNYIERASNSQPN